MASVATFAMAPRGSSWAVSGARVFVLVVQGADLEGTLATGILNTVAAGAVADDSVGPLNTTTGAGLVILVGLRGRVARAGRGEWGFPRLVPVVVRMHGRAVRV